MNKNIIRDISVAIVSVALFYTISTKVSVLNFLVNLLVIGFSYGLFIALNYLIADKMQLILEPKLWKAGILFGIIFSFLHIFAPFPLYFNLKENKLKRWASEFSIMPLRHLGIFSISAPIIMTLIGIILHFIALQTLSRVFFLISLFNMLPFKGLNGIHTIRWSLLVWSLYIVVIILLIAFL